jgi:hypothetical protein
MPGVVLRMRPRMYASHAFCFSCPRHHSVLNSTPAVSPKLHVITTMALQLDQLAGYFQDDLSKLVACKAR